MVSQPGSAPLGGQADGPVGESARDGAGDWAQAWACALDDLELTLDQADALLRGDWTEAQGLDIVTAWALPELRGPMPVDLRTRALELHHRQQRLLQEAARAAAVLRRQAELAARISTFPSEPSPRYLDITA